MSRAVLVKELAFRPQNASQFPNRNVESSGLLGGFEKAICVIVALLLVDSGFQFWSGNSRDVGCLFVVLSHAYRKNMGSMSNHILVEHSSHGRFRNIYAHNERTPV